MKIAASPATRAAMIRYATSGGSDWIASKMACIARGYPDMATTKPHRSAAHSQANGFGRPNLYFFDRETPGARQYDGRRAPI